MYLQFREEFDLPAHRIFPYFATPADWATLYGAAGDTKTKGDGWYAVPLERFPFPLVARNVAAQPDRLVRWVFGGFWRGVGEVQLIESGGGTVVEGFEYITAHGFWLLATAFEERFMTAEFERIWALGWNRIRRNEQQHRGRPTTSLSRCRNVTGSRYHRRQRWLDFGAGLKDADSTARNPQQGRR